jgi:adenylate cyclase
MKTISEVRIPIDEMGQMQINYVGPATGSERQFFPYRSITGYATTRITADPSQWRPTRRLENKILMIGPFSQGMADDEKLTPFGLMYGVEIHTNALNTILMNSFIVHLNEYLYVLLLFVAIFFASFLASRLSPVWSLFANFNALVIWFGISYVAYMEYSVIIPYMPSFFGILAVYLIVVAYRIIVEEREKRSLQSSFGKFVNPVVVEQMISSPPELGGVDKELTVLFSDIRGFTTLSEGLAPQELVNHLNEYLTAMTDTIMDYQGTLDKYVGDEIMCFWGAPLDQINHTELAAKCALKQMEKLNELNDAWPDHKKINIGIGLNSGIMTVGNMGSLGRMNYTLMGDNVNLGARLEGINKVYGTNVIISEYTYAKIKDKAIVRELDNIRVKGKNKPVLIYELLDFTDGIDPIQN